MSSLTIKTNNSARPLVAYTELSAEHRKEVETDIADESCKKFFVYKGNVYDVNDFMRIVTESKPHTYRDVCVADDSPMRVWEYALQEAMYSGIVFRFERVNGIIDMDKVVVGRYYH